jgi:hypothetical protein
VIDKWVVAFAAGLPEVGIGNLIESLIPSGCNSARSINDFNAVDASASDRRRVLHSAAVARIEVMPCAPTTAPSRSATIAVRSSRILAIGVTPFQ